MLVGRDDETLALTAAIDASRAGHGSTIVVTGDAGMGKSTLLEAAFRSCADLTRLGANGMETETGLPHSALSDLIGPIRSHLDQIADPQARALGAALGWESDRDVGDRRFLVAAGTLSTLADAAALRPVVIFIDDEQWIDEESRGALSFAARRLRHDPVVFVLASRQPAVHGWSDPTYLRLNGISAGAVAELIGSRASEGVAEELLRRTGGNPLAITHALAALTPEQRRGSATFPADLAPPGRICDTYAGSLDALTTAGRRALVLCAASSQTTTAPVLDGLASEGFDADEAILDAERAGLITIEAGSLTFAHPLVRSAAWSATSAEDRRSAHRTLAGVLSADPQRQVRHLSNSTIGHDDTLAQRLRAQAQVERAAHGYASASALAERASDLFSGPAQAAACQADAIEDALTAGDGPRVRHLADRALADATDSGSTARVRLALGILEEYAGSMPQARNLLTLAAQSSSGLVRLRALTELAAVSYRLGEPTAMDAAADAAAMNADPTQPEQLMLAEYCQGAALAFAGRRQDVVPHMSRALDLLESDPELRDDPRYLATSLLAAGWLGQPELAEGFFDRRLAAARHRGAIGVLPLALSLVAGGAGALGRHQLAYAAAGEAIELGVELGYVADVAVAYGVQAWQLSARGLHGGAASALAEARRLEELAGVGASAVHLELVDSFMALSRGDLPHVVQTLTRRLKVDEGRRPRGDYPLSVVPDLVEAHVGLGNDEEASLLAAQFMERYRDSASPEIRAHRGRIAGLVAPGEEEAESAFTAAHLAHAEYDDAFEAARTRLAHGSRLRRIGSRVSARIQLRLAIIALDQLGLDGWRQRAEQELVATGERRRRGAQEGDQLSSQETRVAMLVARGMSNREIAAALFLSPKTVEHHLGRALRKRGLRSRTQLAVAFAAGQPS